MDGDDRLCKRKIAAKTENKTKTNNNLKKKILTQNHDIPHHSSLPQKQYRKPHGEKYWFLLCKNIMCCF